MPAIFLQFGVTMSGTFLSRRNLRKLDLFDAAQLACVVRVCRRAHNLSEAGRLLFAHSRERKRNVNDADRLRKYLAKFGLDWESVTSFGKSRSVSN